MQCTIIGASDSSVLWRFGKIKEKDYPKFVSDYALFLSKHFSDVVITPSDGVYADIGVEFGKITKKKPLAYYPDGDAFYSLKYFGKNLSQFDLKPIGGDVYKLDGSFVAISNCVICLGLTPGGMIEISFMKYHQNYGALKDPKLKNIHLFIDERCIESRLPKVFHEQIANIYYYNSLDELEKLIYAHRVDLE